MRCLLLCGAAALTLAGALPAEARGGRFSGFRTHHTPVRASEPVRTRAESAPLGGLTLRLGPEAASRPVPVAGGLPVRPLAGAATPVPVAGPAPVREASAKEPRCPTGRLVGGSQDPASGFCLIN
ncbi:hypothetical protein [Methylobacterium oxalidis]|uniref:hypothetical protein n=1 Tax=Methylobacterium oxalidis TaxID=944322 RepID=UPI003314D204